MGFTEPTIGVVGRRALGRVLLACAASVLVAVVVCACDIYSFQLRVQNKSPNTYFVRVPYGSSGLHDVSKVDPGANGFAAAWRGETTTIELLDEQCHVLGTFQPGEAANTMSVPGVDSMSGTVVPWTLPPPQPDYGTHLTGDCGGMGPRM